MITEQDIAMAVERVAALYGPDRIYLFGSHAKGTATDRSDVDLLVVRDSELPRWMRGRGAVTAMAALAFRVDLLFATPREIADGLRDPHSVFSRIATYAVPVYQRPGVRGDGALAS